ncbi:hypothetical protein F5B22DRAFT_62949 [Xylaria bambusicola]|uniref:uncharacterized protein n=1 Tax=Xylaria bambusicola TaxID=326684 RepID=UPI002008A907|nr:uncharacterized protein F5B22DRAFT_62949 [Xylaria bambusicola]KAI0518440.1 hypothetical protein F5B22DRAFT_62949 [Xylaria bambusicola]
MLALLSARRQTWSHSRLDRLFFTFLVALLVYPSYAYGIPVYTTEFALRDEPSSHKKPENLTLDFAAAMGIITAAVIIGMAVICVFAHCWRQIVKCSQRRRERSAAKKRRRLRKDENTWVFPGHRGFTMPQLQRLESEPASSSPFEQIRRPGAYADPCHNPVSPAIHKSSGKPAPRTRSKTRWDDSTATLPSSAGADEIECPANVAYALERH